MITLFAVTHPALHAMRHLFAERLHRDPRGEGGISADIAALAMAFLGAALWLAFDNIFTSTTDRTSTQVEQSGS